MEPITIVSGLPRSGTSMMMQMLEAGGIPTYQDQTRPPNPDNPKGYYEHQKIKNLADDSSWLTDVQGKAIKIISFLLPHLLQGLPYRIIFLQREMSEILASQKKMLKRNRQAENTVSDEIMAAKFSIHLRNNKKFLHQQGMPVLYVQFSTIIADPIGQAEQINDFLGGGLNTEKMAAIVDKNLYRQKG